MLKVDKILSMLINFTKMHGLGNDFMMIDNVNGLIKLSTKQIAQLSQRNFGVGFDQLLMVESSATLGVDFSYVIYNADGSEVAQCGNGARCFARFVTEKGLTNNNPITVETSSGLMYLFVNEDNSVRVDMGVVNFDPKKIPLLVDIQADTYKIEGYEMGALAIGNPHCVMIFDDINSVDVEFIAPRIQNSALLPQQANIGFMQIISRNAIALRVYERGAGETLACGSGACAAVIHGVRMGLLDTKVKVNFNFGEALVEYQKDEHVFLSGAAEFVFEGQVEI